MLVFGSLYQFHCDLIVKVLILVSYIFISMTGRGNWRSIMDGNTNNRVPVNSRGDLGTQRSSQILKCWHTVKQHLVWTVYHHLFHQPLHWNWFLPSLNSQSALSISFYFMLWLFVRTCYINIYHYSQPLWLTTLWSPMESSAMACTLTFTQKYLLNIA